MSAPTEKAVSKSVSMPEALWGTVEDHAPTTPGRDRSGYIRNLVEDDLKKNGPLAAQESAKAEVFATAEELGMDEAKVVLDRALQRKKAKHAA